MDIEKIRKNKPIKELLEFSIVNIDKPSGPTSFGVDSIVKRNLNSTKTSHFGTLDPKVTGVLPIALSRACRLLGYFIKKDKTYVGVMELHQEVSDKALEEAIKKFTGKITQLPPIRSSVKRAQREREIYRFEILEKSEDGKHILFEVECEAGTYIRKLLHDLGEELGCGAHMAELRRTKAGIFSEEDEEFVNVYDFEKAVEEYKKGNDKELRKILIPGEIITKILPVAVVKKEVVKKLYTGSPLFNKFLKKEAKIDKNQESVVIFDDKDKFIGIYKLSKEKEIYARPEFVYAPLQG